jgi:NADH dehydrogenase
LLAAQHLKKVPVEVTLIDRRNYHLFQPLLYQVATGGLSPANISAPLRSVFKNQKNVRTLMAEVTDFDLANRRVLLKDAEPVPFDSLILAAGAMHHYFGQDAKWEPLASGLKTIEDATEIRRRILMAFEKAELETDPAKRQRFLNFDLRSGAANSETGFPGHQSRVGPDHSGGEQPDHPAVISSYAFRQRAGATGIAWVRSLDGQSRQ